MRSALALLVAAALLAGCGDALSVDLTVARVPDRLLEGAGGNGWEKNQTASQRDPVSGQNGFAKSQTLVYEDVQDPAYRGSLTVTSLRALVRPSEETIKKTVQDRVRDEAIQKGIKIDAEATTGTRDVASGGSSYWFVYNGSVEQSGFFSRNANVKVFGEVFACSTERTDVVTVGLASTTDVRSIGGIPIPSDPNPATWNEIVADPHGAIEGVAGANGLAYNVACH